MGGAQVERRVARISLNSNFELRHSCFVYLFTLFYLFVFFVVVIRAGTYYFLRLCTCPLPTRKNRGFSRGFRSGGVGGYLLSLHDLSET